MAKQQKPAESEGRVAPEFGNLKPVAAGTVEVVPTGFGRRGTVYQPLIEAMQKMKIGQQLPIPVPADTDVKTYMNRIGGALRTHPPKLDEGVKFRMSASLDGKQVVIVLHKPIPKTA